MSSYAYIINTFPENGILVIDTCGTGSGRVIAGALREAGLNLAEIRGVAITHWHRDHTGGLAELLSLASEEGAGTVKIFMHKYDSEIYQNGRGRFVRFHPFLRLPVYHSPGTLPCKGLFEFVDLEEGMDYNPLLSWGIEFIHVPGHTPGNLSFYQNVSGILFSGSGLLSDGVNTAGVSPVFYNRGEQLESARRLMNMDFNYLYPAHMKPLKNAVPREKRKYRVGGLSPVNRIKGFLPLFDCEDN